MSWIKNLYMQIKAMMGSEVVKKVADVNHDGKVDMQDVEMAASTAKKAVKKKYGGKVKSKKQK